MLNGTGYASEGYFHRNGTFFYKMKNQNFEKIKVPIICNYTIIRSGDCCFPVLIDSRY